MSAICELPTDVEVVVSAERMACCIAADNIVVRASKLTFTIPAFSDDVGAELVVCCAAGWLGAHTVLAAWVEVCINCVRFTGGMICTKERIKSEKRIGYGDWLVEKGMWPCSRKQMPCLAFNQDEMKHF